MSTSTWRNAMLGALLAASAPQLVLAVDPPAAANAANSDLSKFAGAWEHSITYPNPAGPPQTYHIVTTYDAKGTFTEGLASQRDIPYTRGVFEASNGRYRVKAANGPPPDEGTYRFVDADTIEMQSSRGPKWLIHRVKPGDGPVIAQPDAGTHSNAAPIATKDQVPVERPKDLTAVDPVIFRRVTDAKARAWHDDAVLAHIKLGHLNRDGTVNLFQDTTAINFIYYSPSAGQTLSVLPQPNGDALCYPAGAAGVQHGIPSGAISLRQALAGARAGGWTDDPQDAELSVWEGYGDKPPRVCWIIHPMVTGRGPVCLISAASGVRLPLTAVMDDADKAYEDLARRARDAMAAAIRQSAPQQPANATAGNDNGYRPMSMAERFAPWNQHYKPANFPGYRPPPADNTNRWARDSAADRAYWNNDGAAQSRINSGSASDADRAKYGGGY